VAFVALAAVAPVAALATVVPGAFTQGILVVPLVFATLGVVLLLFAVGYVATAGRAPHAGALYSCIARGLGRPVGAGAGWLALASYQAIQFGLYGLAGAAAAPQLGQWFGADIPWWAVAAGCWLLVALLGAVRVELVGGLLAALVLAEVAVLAGFGAADLLDPAGHRITLDPLDPTPLAGIDRPALGLLLVVAALAFVGFETTAAYGEEARGPRRALARST
jgi:amino acid transporter